MSQILEKMRLSITILVLLVYFGNMKVAAQFLQSKQDIEKATGYFNFYYSENEGKLYLEVLKERISKEFLYVHSLRTGLGSNDIGLDRGQLGGQAVVKFIKRGNKLLLLQPNLNYRATTTNILEQQSVQEAFATSILFGFDIKETTLEGYIIDVTPFLMEDAHGIIRTLKNKNEGVYAIDKNRSVLWKERTKSFPKNTEFEALLTLVGKPTGTNIKGVVPNSNSISIIQHHSFVALPDANYTPRVFDPRCGSFSINYLDYSTPIWEPIKKRLITRHRLAKKNKNLPISEAVNPIVYYLDPGAPEPVRSALLEGASWWNEAFEAIGYKNAFQIKMLPPDADPMDVRYNVIQWVHRSTRGWSYGASVIDPRTGEIIKGHVSLGSLRIRQDFMIAQALMEKPFENNDTNYQPMLDMALARIRQLAAHEVGHTLGFAHNFAASANNRASVMDYPHPLITLNDSLPDFSNAYATGIGSWDRVATAYSYSDIPINSSAKDHLNTILQKAQDEGLTYISDADARAKGGAHATAHLWDNGLNAAKELYNIMELRKKRIANFSIDNIRSGEPHSVLEDVFVPLYFYHRYQTEAAIKMIGGMEYAYTIKGDGQEVHKVITSEAQEEALKAVLSTLTPDALKIPPHILQLFPPRAYDYRRDRESFKSNNGVAFDAIGAAATSSDMTLSVLLHPQRANRMVQQAALHEDAMGFHRVLKALKHQIFSRKNIKDDYGHEIQQTIQYSLLQHIMNIAASPQSTPQTKAIAYATLKDISGRLKALSNPYKSYLSREISAFMRNPEKFKPKRVPKIPDGSPIGTDTCTTLN